VNTAQSTWSRQINGKQLTRTIEGQADPIRERLAVSVLRFRLRTSKAPYQIDIDLGMAEWSRSYRERNPKGERKCPNNQNVSTQEV
jgi:hypothetical protein